MPQQTATQIVEDLPTRQGRNQVTSFLSMLIAHVFAQPSGNLPVATGPSMLSPGKRVVVRGIVVQELDVGNQGRARENRFEEIVTQQRLLRHTTFQCLLESIHIVKPLACINPLSKKILIDIRGGSCVRIDYGV